MNKRTEGNDRLSVVPLCSFCALLLYGFVSLLVSNLPINDWLAVIAGEEGLDIGFGIESLAAEDDVWQNALLAVFLQGAATEFQVFGEFLVGEITLTVQRWTVGFDEG